MWTFAASSSATKSAANSRGPITATRARRPSLNRGLIHAPSAITSQEPRTTASYCDGGYASPTATAISHAAPTPNSGAASPSSTRLAGITCSGSCERSIAWVAIRTHANTISGSPISPMCR